MANYKEINYPKCSNCKRTISSYQSIKSGVCGICVSHYRQKSTRSKSKIIKGIINIINSDKHTYYTAKEFYIRLSLRNIFTSEQYINYLLNKKLCWLFNKQIVNKNKVYWIVK